MSIYAHNYVPYIRTCITYERLPNWGGPKTRLVLVGHPNMTREEALSLCPSWAPNASIELIKLKVTLRPMSVVKKKKREKWRVLGQHQLFSRLIFRAPNCQGTTSHTCPIWKVFGCQTMLPSTRAWERWRAKLCPGVWRLTNVSVWDNWVELLTSVMMLQQNCLRINVEPCKPLLKWHDVQECHFQDLFMDGINAAET